MEVEGGIRGMYGNGKNTVKKKKENNGIEQ